MRGNLQWAFFKGWAKLLGLVGVAAWFFAGRNLGWPLIVATVVVSALVLYVLAGFWAARISKQFDWVDDGNAYRPVEKK